MMLKGDLKARWLAFHITVVMLAATSPAAAAEGDQIETAAAGAVDLAGPADRAASVLAGVERPLKTTMAAVDAAAADVAEREAAKNAADQEAYRAMAHATESLQAGSQGATSLSEEERSKLWQEVTRAIQASEEAGRLLLEARATLDAARKAAVKETRRVVAEVKAVRTTAAKEVERLSAEAARLAEEVEQAVGDVAAAEAARAAAEAKVQRSQQRALQAINRTAEARRALADAQAIETAIEDELARLTAEVERLAEEVGSGL